MSLCQLSTVAFAVWGLCTGPCPQIRAQAKPQPRGHFPKAIKKREEKLNSVFQRLGLPPAEMILNIKISQYLLCMQVIRSIPDTQFIEITSPSPIDVGNSAQASSVSISLFLCLEVFLPILSGASMYGKSRALSSNTNSSSPCSEKWGFRAIITFLVRLCCCSWLALG